ncbi:hypothetical protein CPB85DRAFT_156330 [Mucidula mucida]|nr:hypothetical protein CPB85DRAFT_156330 [Mucidula mucida]
MTVRDVESPRHRHHQPIEQSLSSGASLMSGIRVGKSRVNAHSTLAQPLTFRLPRFLLLSCQWALHSILGHNRLTPANQYAPSQKKRRFVQNRPSVIDLVMVVASAKILLFLGLLWVVCVSQQIRDRPGSVVLYTRPGRSQLEKFYSNHAYNSINSRRGIDIDCLYWIR